MVLHLLNPMNQLHLMFKIRVLFGVNLLRQGGSVEITTDLSSTQIGTYFEVYHAADGDNCSTGLQPITAIKDKYEYLFMFNLQWNRFFRCDPEANITLDACNPVPLFTYQKLIGEVYCSTCK